MISACVIAYNEGILADCALLLTKEIYTPTLAMFHLFADYDKIVLQLRSYYPGPASANLVPPFGFVDLSNRFQGYRFMSSRHVLALCVLLGASSLTAQSAMADPASALIHARHGVKLGVLPSVMLASVQENPAAYIGRSIEISGSVGGFVAAGAQRTMLLSTEQGSVSIPLPSTYDSADWINTGSKVRILVALQRAPGDLNSPVDFHLTAAALEDDVVQADKIAAEGWERRGASTSRSLVYSRTATQTRVGVSLETYDDPHSGGAPIAWLPERARSVYGPYRDAIRRYNKRLSDADVDKITTSVLYFSDQSDIDPRLVIAMIISELGFDIYSTSHTGAMGLGQLMPSTASGMGVTDPYDPIQNVGAAVRILRGHLDKYGGAPPKAGVIPFNQIALTMAAYNAGPGAVRKFHGVPPYKETQRYVARVASIYKQLCGQ